VNSRVLWLLSLLTVGTITGCDRSAPPQPTPPLHADRTAELIFRNECAGKTACLTSWNNGEEFASLGIGHFIWYPAGTPETARRFQESFPELLAFLAEHGVELPHWLQTATGCPWPDRNVFEDDRDTAHMQQLRQILQQTMPLQARFMQVRAAAAFPKLLDASPDYAHAHLLQQYERVRLSPMGGYALTDYVNFKGEGTNPRERYHNRGWGLLQVLAEMKGEAVGPDALREFARAADVVLTRRVRLSPPERHESRWLPGWRKRLSTYPAEAMRISSDK